MSSHPVVLAAFSRALLPPVFQAFTHRLDSMLAGELRRLVLPGAPVYVVDASASQDATAALIANVLKRSPAAKLLIVSEKFSAEESHDLLSLGAKGLLTYAEARGQLPRALPLLAAGGFWVPRALLSAFVDSVLESTRPGRLKEESAGELTEREKEVLDALLENLANQEIASRLKISERTVKFHVSNILGKFGVRRRADLILLYYQKQKS